MNSSEVGEGLLLLRIPYLRQVDDTKKSSCIRRSLFAMRLIYNTVIARNRINSFDSLFFRESDLRDRIKRINKLFIGLR